MRRRISEEKKEQNTAIVKQQALLFQEYLKQQKSRSPQANVK
jgi:hypothetical protein